MFHDIYIRNGPATAPGRDFSTLRWWAAATIREFWYREQKLCLSAPYPGSEYLCGGPYAMEYNNAKGVTLAALWALRGSPAQQHQLLRAAVLHQWVGNARCTWPREVGNRWPSESQVRQLYRRALEGAGRADSPWRYPQVHCLPELPYEVQRQNDLEERYFGTVGALSQAVDAQVRLFLTYWAPVYAEYGRRCDEVLLARMRADMVAAAQAEALARAKVMQEVVAPTQPSEDSSKRETRVRVVWPATERLKALVWAKPLREVAVDFGVSDVAVKKACKARGIETPPRGYWLTSERRLNK